jgi:nucleoside-diphosphate-sugar epimerase
MKLFVFGLGYSALAFIEETRGRFAALGGTVTSPQKAGVLRAWGIEALAFDGTTRDPEIADWIADSDAVLVSVPPDRAGDPVLRHFAGNLAAASRLGWIGYLSTLGVYGDHAGAWVDEETKCEPLSPRNRARLKAEGQWLKFGKRAEKPVQVFRLAGIYGPGRNALAQLREGTARRIFKAGQVMNRIHVADIAGALAASLARPMQGAVFNVCDDEPAPPQDVVAHAAFLMGVAPPPEVPIAEAELSPMAASFYAECKRASNAKLRRELGWTPRFPSYREGLAALYRAGEGARRG